MSTIDDTAQDSVLQRFNDLQDSPWTSQIELEDPPWVQLDCLYGVGSPVGEGAVFSNVENPGGTLAENMWKLPEEKCHHWFSETAWPISASFWSRPQDGELESGAERDGNEGLDTYSYMETFGSVGYGSDEKSTASGWLSDLPAAGHYTSTERPNLSRHLWHRSDDFRGEPTRRESGLRRFGLAGLAATATAGAGALSFLASGADRDRWRELVPHLDPNSPHTAGEDFLAPALVASIAVTTTAMTGYHYLNRFNTHQDPMICLVGIAGAIIGWLAGLDATAVLLRVVPWCVLAAMVVSSMWAPRWAEERRVLLK